MFAPKPHLIRTLFLFRPLFHPQNPKPLHETPSIYTKSLTPTSIFRQSISLSTQFQQEFKDCQDAEKESKTKNNLRKKNQLKKTKTLDSFFEEAVGLSKEGQIKESEKGFRKLSNLFSSGDQRGKKLRTECKKEDELMEFKELSPDMAMFADYLHTKGYFGNANFLPNNKFDVSCFVNSYARDFLKFAAEEFAKDHREIFKWLSTNDLKKVAQFGCPSLGRKIVFSSKAMRFHFGIKEETVCNKCVLKESCKFANQSVWKKGAKNVDLAVVMRVITLYALPTRFEVPEDVRDAVNHLLKEVIRLSEIES